MQTTKPLKRPQAIHPRKALRKALKKALRLEKTNTFGVNVSLGSKPMVKN
jgi:hypothetical protein